MIVEGFIFLGYFLGTCFGFYWGIQAGQMRGLEAAIDTLIETGYLRWKGHKRNPQIMKWNEKE